MNVFPRLPGLAWPVKKTAIVKTLRRQSLSGRETRLAFMRYPRYAFELSYNYLTQDHVEQLVGFYAAVATTAAEFFFDAGPGDNAVERAGFGVGDGATTTFELMHSIGGWFAEPVGGSFGARSAFVANADAAATFSDADNTVTFDAAPTAGAALQWTGNYYYRVVFDDDSQGVEQFLSQIYESKTVRLKSVVPAAP